MREIRWDAKEVSLSILLLLSPRPERRLIPFSFLRESCREFPSAALLYFVSAVRALFNDVARLHNVNLSALLNTRHPQARDAHAPCRNECRPSTSQDPPIENLSSAGKLSRIIGKTASSRVFHQQTVPLYHETTCDFRKGYGKIAQKKRAKKRPSETDGPRKSIYHFLGANTRLVFARSLGNDA